MPRTATPSTQMSRRQFVGSTLAGLASAGPSSIATAGKSESSVTVGSRDLTFEVDHDWAQLPAPYHWQTTHNVAVDREGLVYVIHEGRTELKDHPSIFVFNSQGRFVRAFGTEFQGGGHGLDIRVEGGEEFLYVTAYMHLKCFAKLTLLGERVWKKRAPQESGCYLKEESTAPENSWGRDRFMPTNTAFLPDGGFLLADGYGAWRIHRYDSNGTWCSAFGGPGEAPNQFDTPHGVWIDDRNVDHPRIVVADRAHHLLKFFELDGRHVSTLDGFGLPANIDRFGELLLVPELFGRVTLLDAENRAVAHLGDDSKRIRGDKDFTIRQDPSAWRPGKFVHPHDACFDSAGNIYVTEWVSTGRVTKLTRLT